MNKMMTREEAIKHLHDDWYIENGRLCVDGDIKDAFLEAVGMGIKALRPVSREQVEKVWRGWRRCMKPYRCPICNGTGIVPGGFYLSVNGYCSTTQTTEMCRQCQGSGIIWGVEDYDRESLVSNNIFGETLKDGKGD